MFKQVNEIIKLSLPDQIIFFEQIAELIDSGVTLRKAIKVSDKRFMQIISRIDTWISAGQLFSAAIEREKQYFDPLVPYFIKIGERVGDLAHGLRDMVRYLQSRNNFITRIKEQLFYPSMVLSVALIAGYLLLKFLFPSITSLFEQTGIALPAACVMLRFVSVNIDVMLGVILVALCVLIMIFYKQRAAIHAWIIERMPWVRNAMSMFFLQQFLQSTSILLSAGVPLIDGLCWQKGLFSSLYWPRLEGIVHRIKHGEVLSSAIEHALRPAPIVIQIVQAAEHSGELTVGLEHAADHLQKRIERGLEKIVQWIEPALTVFVGLIVAGFVLMAFYPLTAIVASLG